MALLNPLAFSALVFVVAPVLIHLLVHRRAERLVFPTLRFIAPSRLASMRRRMLDDVPLLAVRIAILVAAIAAFAAPLIVTAARQREWNARVVTETVQGPDLRDRLRRAVAALEKAPPARREIIVSSAFPLGSLTAADIAAVPASIGLRFERIDGLPETRTVADARILAGAGSQVARDLTFAGVRTGVHEIQTSDRAQFPVEVDAPADAKPAIDAAIAAVLSQRVWAPPANRRARLVISGRSPERAALQASPVTTPWMAEAIARMSRDPELQAVASGAANGLSDPRFKSAPWVGVVAAADGTPVIVAAGSTTELLVVTGAGEYDFVTPLLLRSIVNGLALVTDVRQAEVVAISDAQLRAWSRPAQPPGTPRLGPQAIERVQDDRRWFWAAVLGLLALEAWMRRARALRGQAVGDIEGDVARVA
jgi:aerotolerance regulator-like protein